MPRNRSKRAKKCDVCGKILGGHNKTGLCSHHARIKSNKERRKKRKENHICIQCIKKIEPIILYPAGKTIPPIIHYPIRCYNCRKKAKKYIKKYNLKKKEERQNNKLSPLNSG